MNERMCLLWPTSTHWQIFHLVSLTWHLSFVQPVSKEGEVKETLLWGHMKQLPCTKNQLQRPQAPRLAVYEGLVGGERDR